MDDIGNITTLLEKYEKDIVLFVRKEFGVEPEAYQVDALRAFADPEYKARKVIMKSSAGVGKSACLAWMGMWMMATKARSGVFPKGVMISMSSDNLKDGLHKECALWRQKSPLIQCMFDINQKRFFSKEFPELWGITVRTYDKNVPAAEQGRVLSGLHSPVLLYLTDECGAISPAVGKAIDQGFGEQSQICVRLAAAGNPMDKNSYLYVESEAAKACGNKKTWAISITSDPDDPKRSSRVDAEWARKQIKDLGRSDPWVKIFVLGEFPDVAMTSLLDESEVSAAMERESHEDMDVGLHYGLDVARMGADASCLFPRRGLTTYEPEIIRHVRTSEMLSWVLRKMEKTGEGALLADATGGFAIGICDSMIDLGYIVHEINFGASADESERFYNKRSEIWYLMAQWVKRGGCLPDSPELKKELCAVNYTFDNKGRFSLEQKEQIRKRLGFSPDMADALALTFALPNSRMLERIGSDDDDEPINPPDVFDFGISSQAY